jgi:putative RecB family exonuclease
MQVTVSDETDIATVSHRSFSQINQLRTCGEAYRLERIEKMPQRPSCAAIAGKVVHAASETIDWEIKDGAASAEYIREAAQIDANDALDKEIEQASVGDFTDPATWKRYGRPTIEKPHGEDIEWFRTVGIPKCIDAYVSWRLATPDLTLLDIPGFGPAIEVPFDTYIGGQHVRGYIDRVFVSPDGVPYLCDLKSGQKPKTSEQLETYRYALLTGAGIDVRWGGYLYGLKHGEAKLTPPIELGWSEEKLARLYVQANLLIDRGIFIPHPGADCFNCAVSQHCDFAGAAI